MRIIRAQEFQRMPWKNGGGETVQIAIDERARGLDDFTWRVSMARVERDGPFSVFPDVDRTLSILQGAGMALEIAGHTAVKLDQTSNPFAFPADIPVQARLARGAITDLNVMTRRGRARHFVSRLDGAATMTIRAQGDLMLLLAWGGGCGLQSNSQVFHLDDSDFAILPTAATGVVATPAGSLFLIDLWLA